MILFGSVIVNEHLKCGVLSIRDMDFKQVKVRTRPNLMIHEYMPELTLSVCCQILSYFDNKCVLPVVAWCIVIAVI